MQHHPGSHSLFAAPVGKYWFSVVGLELSIHPNEFAGLSGFGQHVLAAKLHLVLSLLAQWEVTQPDQEIKDESEAVPALLAVSFGRPPALALVANGVGLASLHGVLQAKVPVFSPVGVVGVLAKLKVDDQTLMAPVPVAQVKAVGVVLHHAALAVRHAHVKVATALTAVVIIVEKVAGSERRSDDQFALQMKLQLLLATPTATAAIQAGEGIGNPEGWQGQLGAGQVRLADGALVRDPVQAENFVLAALKADNVVDTSVAAIDPVPASIAAAAGSSLAATTVHWF